MLLKLYQNSKQSNQHNITVREPDNTATGEGDPFTFGDMLQ